MGNQPVNLCIRKIILHQSKRFFSNAFALILDDEEEALALSAGFPRFFHDRASDELSIILYGKNRIFGIIHDLFQIILTSVILSCPWNDTVREVSGMNIESSLICLIITNRSLLFLAVVFLSA